MNHNPGTKAPETGIYWCSVCKTPQRFTSGQDLPGCPNLCGRGTWEFVEKIAPAAGTDPATRN